jgi:RHS repeat-associated protein
VQRLQEVILPDGDLIEYRVDGANRRVAKLKNGIQERQWLWRSKLQPSAEFDGSGALRARFVYAGDRNVPSLIVTPAASYRLITDHLGSVRKVVDVATGVVAQELSYDAWGRVLMDTNPGLQPFGFAGGLYDAETELVRFGARDYDAETGRWTAKDPIRFDGGINLYEYAGSSPIVLVDPTGRIGWAAPLGWVFTLGGGGGALAGAAAVGATASLVAIGLTSVAVGNTLGDDDCDGACSPTTPL